jgi:hypothetical protein
MKRNLKKRKKHKMSKVFELVEELDQPSIFSFFSNKNPYEYHEKRIKEEKEKYEILKKKILYLKSLIEERSKEEQIKFINQLLEEN